MKQALTALAMLAGTAMAPMSLAGEALALDEANQLVGLTKQFEREAQAIRFMFVFPPLNMKTDLVDCAVREAEPAMRSYLASQFAENMNKGELEQSIQFFQSPAGQAVTALRLKHEQSLFDAAVKQEQITDEQLHYPEPVQKELDAFGSTPAGRFFVGDALLERKMIRAHLSDLRSAAITKCMAASR